MFDQPKVSMRPPNLLVFLPDQQRTDTMACYGGTKVHAPALNKLASESVIFEHAYVTQPICTPSRASLLSGLWPHTTGCTRNSVPLEPRFPTFAELLENKDYNCAYMGKWHLGGDASAQRGFRDWVSTEDVSDYSRFLISHGIAPDRENKTRSRAVSLARFPSSYRSQNFCKTTPASLSSSIGVIHLFFLSLLSNRTPFTMDRSMRSIRLLKWTWMKLHWLLQRMRFPCGT